MANLERIRKVLEAVYPHLKGSLVLQAATNKAKSRYAWTVGNSGEVRLGEVLVFVTPDVTDLELLREVAHEVAALLEKDTDTVYAVLEEGYQNV